MLSATGRIALVTLCLVFLCSSAGRADNATFLATSDLSTETLTVPCLEYNGLYLETDFHLISWEPVRLQLTGYQGNNTSCMTVEKNYRHTANGSYNYNPPSGILELDFTSSDYLYECGPSTGSQTYLVQSITATVMVMTNDDDEQEIWVRQSGTAGDIRGTWKYTSENGNTYVSQFGSNGSLTVAGNVGFCGESSLTGIYGQGFEFEFEDIHPVTPGTYQVGSNFDAVDFGNSITPFNLHAYGGSVTITSVSPLFSGTLSLSSFATGHGEIPNLPGNVSGSFSIPYDGSPGGTFQANGTVGPYTINILETNVRLFR